MHTAQQKKAKNGKSQTPAQRASQPALTSDAARKMPAYARRRVQTKVAVGPAGDSFEQEADSVAQRVGSGKDVAPEAISSVAGQKPQESKSPQKAEAKKDDKPPVQKSEEKQEEKKPVQKAGEKKPVQKQEEKQPENGAMPVQQMAEKPPEATTKPVQKAEAKNAPGTGAQQADSQATEAVKDTASSQDQMAMEDAAEQAIQHKGPGRPLNPATQQTLSERMKVNLDHVRIHDGPDAHEACRALHARAFTHGCDIWLAAGESDTDLDLMAHEVTHVIQQTDHVHREAIQRKEAGTGALPEKAGPVQKASSPSSRVQRDVTPPPSPAAPAGGTPSVSVASVTVPVDGSPSPPAGKKFFRAAGYSEGGRKGKSDPKQAVKWDNAIDNAVISGNMKTMLDLKDEHTYLIRATGAGPEYDLVGNATTLAHVLKRPWWKRDGKMQDHQVDHKIDLSLTGWPREQWGNELDNMELLDSKTNQSAGNKTKDAITQAIRSILADKSKTDPLPAEERNEKTLRAKYDIIFDQLISSGFGAGASFYTKKDIEDGVHFKALADTSPNARAIKIYDLQDPEAKENKNVSPLPKGVTRESLLGVQSQFVIYTAEGGGRRVSLPFPDGTDDVETTDPAVIKKLRIWGFEVNKIRFNRSGSSPSAGVLTGKLFPRQAERSHLRTKADYPWELARVPNTNYAGYVRPGLLKDFMNKNLTYEGLSPIQIVGVMMDDEKGLIAVGKILPSIPLIEKLDIDLVLEGNDLRAEKTFYANELPLPPPLRMTGGSLTLGIGTESGLSITGQVDFDIQKVGTGYIRAAASTGYGFELEGGFAFETKLFDKADIKASYKKAETGEYAFGIQGHAEITKEGKLKGVKSAAIDVAYTQGKFAANGSAQLSIPGVKETTLAVTHDEKEGLVITGTLTLAESSVIQSGSGSVTVRKKEGEEYHVSASGKAVPKIPGISASISFSIDDDLFTVEGTAGYEKGMLKGSILIGATNRPVGDDGKPADGPPKKEITPYGGGSVTLKLAPWLQATAGIKILPNGEIEVVGKIGLPSSLKIFDEKKLDKNIFKINIDIPILGISAAGQNVGIFATIGGGLDLSAGIGPGELQDVGVEVTYNPAHEEDTHIVGTAKLHIPAHAGLRLFVRGGLGVGIPLVDARAGLEIGGSLGLEGALDAGVKVDWTPTKGLVIDAKGEAYVEPKLKFDVKAFVEVELDLLLKTITLYENSWNLASFEWGSGLRFGVEFPIHYEEGKPFDISMDDLKFKIPDIQPMEVLSGLVKQIID